MNRIFVNPENPGILIILIGVTQLMAFTLTLTLSLKGEGIAELRNSNPDSDKTPGYETGSTGSVRSAGSSTSKAFRKNAV